MSLIRKNPNEILYPTGKKNLITIIKNEASPQTILWRVPYEDFNEGSKVIVAENEEALFYKNGVIEGLFSGGEYTLNTDNYPFLSRIRNFASGGISAYNCRIIYINKVHQLDNRWGTDGPIQVVDKVFNMAINLVARGAYTIKIEDSKKFYLKFAGSTATTLTADNVADGMRSTINQKIKTTIATVISEMECEIVGISARLESIAERMRGPLETAFDEYGVRMVNFYIEALEIIEDESYSTLKQARADAASRGILATGALNEVRILGKEYGRVKTADIMMASATNPSSGVMGDGLGLGAGMAMGNALGASAANVLSPLNNPQTQSQQDGVPKEGNGNFVAPCGHTIAMGAKFCPECGAPTSLNCQTCGAAIAPGSKFCSECGSRIQ